MGRYCVSPGGRGRELIRPERAQPLFVFVVRWSLMSRSDVSKWRDLCLCPDWEFGQAASALLLVSDAIVVIGLRRSAVVGGRSVGWVWVWLCVGGR